MADNCAEKAARATDVTARRTYEALSRQWVHLDRRAEQAHASKEAADNSIGEKRGGAEAEGGR